MERKKTGLIIVGIFILVLSVVGVTYAFWQFRTSQESEDKIASSCFDVQLESEESAIQLEKAYPISDSEGEELTPYKFTLRNNCQANVKYQINLESLNKIGGTTLIEEVNRLQAQYLKVKINEENKIGKIRLLNENEVDFTLDNAYESHKLVVGYLGSEESKTYELRLWLRGDLTIDNEEVMNKTYVGKINVIATYAKEAKETLEDTILAIEPKTINSGEDGIYLVSHTGENITYTEDKIAIENLQKTEYRYAGVDPNNYVSFGDTYTSDIYSINIEGVGLRGKYDSEESCLADSEPYGGNCEKVYNKGDSIIWRMIGFVNTPEGQRIKLIGDSIADMSWDTSNENINVGSGVNEWSKSDLMKFLNPDYEENRDQICVIGQCTDNSLVNNSLYWNGQKGYYYIDNSNTAVPYDMNSSKMPENLKNMIDDITWNTGSNGEIPYYEIVAKDFYKLERSNNLGKTCETSIYCNDEVPRTTSWKGKVALMYPSDYIYASTGGSVDGTTREECQNKYFASWYDGCYDKDWLWESGYYNASFHTLTPAVLSEEEDYGSPLGQVFSLDADSVIVPSPAAESSFVRPVVYLKPDIFVNSGNGSKDTPYVLSID